MVPSLFSRLSSVFGRLQNPVLLVLSSKNVTVGLEVFPNLLLQLKGFADFERILVLMCFLCDSSFRNSCFDPILRASFLSWSLQKSGGPFFQLCLRSLLVSEFNRCLFKTEGTKRIRHVTNSPEIYSIHCIEIFGLKSNLVV